MRNMIKQLKTGYFGSFHAMRTRKRISPRRNGAMAKLKTYGEPCFRMAFQVLNFWTASIKSSSLGSLLRTDNPTTLPRLGQVTALCTIPCYFCGDRYERIFIADLRGWSISISARYEYFRFGCPGQDFTYPRPKPLFQDCDF